MLKRPLRPCKSPSCNELTSETYCDKHRVAKQQRYDRWRGSSAERGYNHRWRKARLRFLRQNPLCVHCKKEGIYKQANVVDHIISHRRNRTLFWSIDNWQSLCETHHNRKTWREDSLGYVDLVYPLDIPKPSIAVHLVCGASGSGKTTFARQMSNDDDLIVDVDEIKSNISNLPWYSAGEEWTKPALNKRNEMLRKLDEVCKGEVWFIVSAPTKVERLFWNMVLSPKTIYVLETPLEVCKERLTKDSRRINLSDKYIALASDWWEEYERWEYDTVIKDS